MAEAAEGRMKKGAYRMVAPLFIPIRMVSIFLDMTAQDRYRSNSNVGT
jgi:hypothetical protein